MGDVTPLQIGPFAIIRLLRDGPFESVYLGKQQGRAKNYSTIHVFHTPLATDEDREAFLTRAKSLKKLKHRNIAETLNYGLLPNNEQPATRGYLVTQYVSEKSILERFPQGQLAMPDEVKRALSPIADALQYAHASHIYHHHLHPASILIDESKQFLLTGFSPLPPLSNSNDPDALPYMAPEALQGNPGPASDQYSLVVMVYEWLCGRRPYSATDRETLLRQQQSEPLPAPRSLNSAISPAVEQVLLKSLARNPDERYPRPLAFSSEYLRALMGFGGPSIQTTSGSSSEVETGKVPSPPSHTIPEPKLVDEPPDHHEPQPELVDEPPDHREPQPELADESPDHREPQPAAAQEEPRPLTRRFSTGALPIWGIPSPMTCDTMAYSQNNWTGTKNAARRLKWRRWSPKL